MVFLDQKMTIRQRQRRSRHQKGIKSTSNKITPAVVTIAEAVDFFDRFDFEKSASVAAKVIDLLLKNESGTHLQDLITSYRILSASLLEVGRMEEAVAVLKNFIRFLDAQKDSSSSTETLVPIVEALFSLAQMTDAQEAVDLFLQGLNRLAASPDYDSMREMACSAWCSIAEIYMTDLCDAEDAEERCKAAVGEALRMDAEAPESLRMAIELALVLNNREEALKHASKLRSLVLPSEDAAEDESKSSLQDEPSVQDADEDDSSQDEQVMQESSIDYDIRKSIAKVFIELGMFADAMQVLEQLLAEDDQVLETWYLMGLAAEKSGLEEDCAEAGASGLALCTRLGQMGIAFDSEQQAELSRLALLGSRCMPIDQEN